MIWLTFVFVSEILFGVCVAISQRTIYTYFPALKTWNEAKTICESQQGQLVKVRGQQQIAELEYLFEHNDDIMSAISGLNFWTAMHKPFSNSTYTHQDCEPVDGSMIPAGSLSSDRCAYIGSSFSIINANCAEQKPFMCQRNGGECWYEPFFEEQPNPFNSEIPMNGSDPSVCALVCRNYYDTTTNGECWGFTHFPNQNLCLLHGETTSVASSTYINPLKRMQGTVDSTFYVRRCFEGTLDTNAYADILNTNPVPETNCSTTTYVHVDPASQVCFCTTKDHPPIPEPTSSEEKAMQYAKELTIDSSNTSSSHRKLTSAEDNRASAVGVGFLGVGLLTAVFGGLVLLDLGTLITGIRALVCQANSPGEMTETDC